MVLMDGGGGLVQRGAMHAAQDFLPAAASPLPSIMMAYQSRVRLETSVAGVLGLKTHIFYVQVKRGGKGNKNILFRRSIDRSTCVLF